MYIYCMVYSLYLFFNGHGNVEIYQFTSISYSSMIIVGYPSEKAALVALKTVRDFLEKDDTYKNVSLRDFIE